jgi:glutathione S-transferase
MSVRLTLVIANKNYSSWSLRPWILMRHFGIGFDELVIPLAQETTREQILRYSPSGKVPCLIAGDLVVWDSLAIIETLAELFPDTPVWPHSQAARAEARALSAEMHSGFLALRAALPMNMRRAIRKRDLNAEAAADVARFEAALKCARKAHGEGGPLFFGSFSAADAMFAPLVNRLNIYDVAVSPETRLYMDAVMALPAWQDWHAQAQAEAWTIDKYEVA